MQVKLKSNSIKKGSLNKLPFLFYLKVVAAAGAGGKGVFVLFKNLPYFISYSIPSITIFSPLFSLDKVYKSSSMVCMLPPLIRIISR